jgi:hypothetical protein
MRPTNDVRVMGCPICTGKIRLPDPSGIAVSELTEVLHETSETELEVRTSREMKEQF